MPRERFDVEVPEGTHLGVSRDTDGAYRAHLFDDETNGLVGHAELFAPAEGDAAPPTEPSPVFVYIDDGPNYEVEAREPSEVEKLLGSLLLLGVLVAVERAKPHVQEWWTETARPAMRSKWNDLAESRPRRARRRTTSAEPATTTAPAPAPAESTQEVLAALDAYKASMSSEEARARFVAAVTARLVSEEQLAILRNARIQGEDGPLELDTLTARQISTAMTAMLEENPALLDAETAAAELARLLGPSRAESDYAPVRLQRIKHALRPARGDN
jgi:hypothetical protein